MCRACARFAGRGVLFLASLPVRKTTSPQFLRSCHEHDTQTSRWLKCARLTTLIEKSCQPLYNFCESTLSDGNPNSPTAAKPRRWTIFASGLLLIALALVVIYTTRREFLSPLALVVVAAIGLAALLLQLRLRDDTGTVRAPLWLNVAGVVFAAITIFADFRQFSPALILMFALGAVVSFGISGVVVLRALGKSKN